MCYATAHPVLLETLESRLLLSGSIVQFDTNLGSFQVQLFDDATPVAVANFLSYAGSGAYDNTVIHRSVPGFIVQGGGFAYPTFEHIPTADPIVNEPGISNTRGTIAMAKVGGDPHSATSEWFFNLDDNSGPPPDGLDFQNEGFTVFGEVIGNGMNVVDAIAALETFNFGGPFSDFPLTGPPDFDDPDWPTEDDVVLIQSISIVQLQVKLGAGHANSVTFADGDGTIATAAFGSRTGVATLIFTGEGIQQAVGRRGAINLNGDNIQLETIVIEGSGARDNLAINARGGADGRIDVGGIFVDGGLRGINAPNVNFQGNVVVTGPLGGLNIGDISNANINLAGVGRGVSIQLGNVSDLSLFSASPITLLRVRQWLDTDLTPDQIIAPSIGRLQSVEDFGAHIGLSGEGARRNVALGRTHIGGVIGPVDWNIGGHSGALVAGAIAPGFNGNFAGNVAGLRVMEIAHGMLAANSVGNLQAPGVFNMNLALSGEGARRGVALGRINVGELGPATWNVNGHAGRMAAGSIDNGFVGAFGGNLGGLLVLQNASGNITVNSVRNVNVRGALHDGQLVLTQPGGTRAAATRGINVGQNISNYDILAIADLGQVAAAAIHSSMIATQGTVRGLLVRPGGTFADTDVFAATIGNANLGTVLTDNGGTEFGLTAGSINRLDFTPAGGDPLRFVRLTDQETFTNFIVNSGIDLGDFRVNIV